MILGGLGVVGTVPGILIAYSTSRCLACVLAGIVFELGLLAVAAYG